MRASSKNSSMRTFTSPHRTRKEYCYFSIYCSISPSLTSTSRICFALNVILSAAYWIKCPNLGKCSVTVTSLPPKPTHFPPSLQGYETLHLGSFYRYYTDYISLCPVWFVLLNISYQILSTNIS